MSRSQRKLKCAECNRNKGNHLFYKRKTKRGYDKLCKSCRKRTHQFKEQLNKSLLSKYNLTEDEYTAILKEQENKCFICGKEPYSKRLAVDHDHEQERNSDVRSSIRGLLCYTCNNFLGHVKDDPEAGDRITEYLTRPYWVERGTQ